MLIDPDKTALIILGASHFPNYRDQDYASFSSAHRQLREYFLEADYGPRLSEDKVRDLFDDDSDASEQINEVEKFICNDLSLEHLFVYIVTHGKLHEDRFYLAVQTTRDYSETQMRGNTYILFEDLYNSIVHAGRARAYFIVDACYSGKIHKHHAARVLSYEPSSSPQEWNGESGRGGSATILTAGSLEGPGPVYGRDEERPPLFTRCLLETLKNGVKGGYSYGLSLSTLAYEINECYRRKLPELNGPDFLSETRTQISERDRYEADGRVRPSNLSDTPVFLNNDPTNVRELFREASRAIAQRRSAEVKNSDLTREKEQLQNENSDLKTERIQLQNENLKLTRRNEELQEKNSELTTEGERLQKEHVDISATNKVLERENMDFKQDFRTATQYDAKLTAQENANERFERINRRLLWVICFVAVLPLLIVALVLSVEPELRNVLISGIASILARN